MVKPRRHDREWIFALARAMGRVAPEKSAEELNSSNQVLGRLSPEPAVKQFSEIQKRSPEKGESRQQGKFTLYWTSTPVWGAISVLIALAVSPWSVKFVYLGIWESSSSNLSGLRLLRTGGSCAIC
jgi:hypothetical protein